MSVNHKIAVFLAMAGLCALAALIVLGDNGLADMQALRQEHRQMVQDNESLAWKNAALLREIQRLEKDAAYIENVARRQLGFIGKDEFILKLNDSSDGAP